MDKDNQHQCLFGVFPIPEDDFFGVIMMGTGIVPKHGFTVSSGEEIKISIDGIGALGNEVG